MERVTFRHLGREWEATIPQTTADPLPVRFRDADDRIPTTREALLAREELDPAEPADRELALRRGLESALVLDALAGATHGLTAEDVAERTGMPVEAAEDRMHVLDSVQLVPGVLGTRRFRTVD
jgi:hypothetical protein